MKCVRSGDGNAPDICRTARRNEGSMRLRFWRTGSRWRDQHVASPVQKRCIVPLCDGTMRFDDSEMPSYVIWACDRQPGHREVLPAHWKAAPEVKPCSVTGCRGRMTFFTSHRRSWECDLDREHIEYQWSFAWLNSPRTGGTEYSRAVLRTMSAVPTAYLDLLCYGCGERFRVDPVESRIFQGLPIGCRACGREGPLRADAEAHLGSLVDLYGADNDENGLATGRRRRLL